MHTDMNTAKITAETLLELELKSLGLAGVPNRFKTAGFPLQNLCSTFPNGKEDTDSSGNGKRDKKKKNIPEDIIC